MRNSRSSLSAAASMALALAAMPEVIPHAAPASRSGTGRNYRPQPQRLDSALAREIAEHNAEVERRNAEKRAAKAKRRKAGTEGGAR